MSLVTTLEDGRLDFLDAARDIVPERASARPAPGAWSALECIEHVVIVEGRYLGWLLNGVPISPKKDMDKEFRLFTLIRSRLTKMDAPEVIWPAGRFDSLATALAEFKATRDRSVQAVEERGDSIYAVSARHPFFGEMNGAELIHLMDGHARRHADQIREACEILAGGRSEDLQPRDKFRGGVGRS